MSSIYRVRPATQKSVDEIKNHYLFFSKPSCYKDSEDANILFFVKNNESIEEAFARLYTPHTNIVNASAEAGICCFTLLVEV